MAGLIEKLLNKGRDPEEDERIKREADAAAERYAQQTGAEPPEEPGIIEADPLPSQEDSAYYMDLKDPDTGEVRRGQALMGMGPPPSLLGGLKAKGMPQPRFDEVGGPESGQDFAKFIRKQEPKIEKPVAKAFKPETDPYTMRKATDPSRLATVKDLQLEMQLEAAKGTREGDLKAKELLNRIRELQGNK